MTTYYKAVQVTGTDFVTGTTRPVIGQWMKDIEGELIPCVKGYHVSDTPSETLVGGCWPCKLFEVEILEEDTPSKWILGHKRVTRSYLPIRELPSWMVFGPNGDKVVALFDRIEKLTPDELSALLEGGRGVNFELRYFLVGLVKDLAEKYGRWAGFIAAQAPMFRAFSVASDRYYRLPKESRPSVNLQAIPHVLQDAVSATIFSDLLATRYFDFLYSDWSRVIDSTERGEK